MSFAIGITVLILILFVGILFTVAGLYGLVREARPESTENKVFSCVAALLFGILVLAAAYQWASHIGI